MKKKIYVLLLIAVCCVITYGYALYQFEKEQDVLQASVNAAAKSLQQTRTQLDLARKDLDRFKTWNAFIQIQTQLSEAENEITALNFGKAIQILDGIQNRIVKEDQGAVFDDRRHELTGYLEKSKESLRQKNERAARYSLNDFNKKTLEIFAGVSPVSSTDEEPEVELPEEVPQTRPLESTQSPPPM